MWNINNFSALLDIFVLLFSFTKANLVIQGHLATVLIFLMEQQWNAANKQYVVCLHYKPNLSSDMQSGGAYPGIWVTTIDYQNPLKIL